MLHAAAKKIVKEHGGKFPEKAEDLLALPGIGRYTASAIASIALDEPVAVVDGNVERVLQRVREKILQARICGAQPGLLGQQRPGDFNQAMMELGATVCLPRQLMSAVPGVRSVRDARRSCRDRGKGTRRTKREITHALACRNGSIFLVQRQASTLMPNIAGSAFATAQ